MIKKKNGIKINSRGMKLPNGRAVLYGGLPFTIHRVHRDKTGKYVAVIVNDTLKKYLFNVDPDKLYPDISVKGGKV